MPEVILHHYETSPFGTAMRLALGLKGISWKSVEAPMIAPKPDLSALTGGYERIPVLQIGADIYCDTDCITDALEAYKPEPSLYPAPLGRSGKLIALWSGSSWFMPAVGTALGTDPSVVSEEFWNDRKTRFGMNPKTFLPAVPHLTAQFHAGAAKLETALADGRDFIGGDCAGHADFALWVNIHFVRFAGIVAADFAHVIEAWYGRVEAIGHGSFEEWIGEQAIEHAKQNDPINGCSVPTDSGFSEGQQVAIKTDSPDPAIVTGTLVGLDDSRISISRTSDATGEVHVHFPRLGQVLMPA
ncbi:MAG: glutathione S-transferase family protein [Parasphingorhabdus sp.]